MQEILSDASFEERERANKAADHKNLKNVRVSHRVLGISILVRSLSILIRSLSHLPQICTSVLYDADRKSDGL